MWNEFVTFVGWALFYLVILLWVGWVLLERAYFAGQDPEAWRADAQLNDPPTDRPGAASPLGSLLATAMGRPT